MSYSNIKNTFFLIYELSHFSMGHIWLQSYDSFFRFTLLLLGDKNNNTGPTTVNDDSIPLNSFTKIHNSHEPAMLSECNSCDFSKAHYNSKWKVFKKNKTLV